jgi:hypothetical protein
MRGLGVFEQGMVLVTAGILVAAVGVDRGTPRTVGAPLVVAALAAGITVLTLFAWAARRRAATARLRRRG